MGNLADVVKKCGQTGKGFINSAINNLPFEMHLPGHNFTGPRNSTFMGKTRFNSDLSYKDWSKPINRVDKAAYNHDVCYLKNKDTKSDTVRTSKFKTKFMRGYDPTFTEEIFKISEVLKTDPITYKIKDLNEEEIKEDKLDLITRKGVYPYDYMDCEEKYKETELPPKEAFYNRLNECDISDEDYKHAQNVWKSFNINNLREYSKLYVKTDVLILSDIFENFRDVCLKTYKLDPAWYFTAPGLSWNAMLKKTS
ncbi:uncharacterized protein CEXT_131881 [Caerostris extrusa]|uniref:Phospholipase A2-like domain-containing protein n=1 Tax=Caerostris extrusa TaxID=172846 RepID=A0AAV4VX57_CAEEX|nr:uncharacterized protein CEXT_131881 [Caerostris extrusa]